MNAKTRNLWLILLLIGQYFLFLFLPKLPNFYDKYDAWQAIKIELLNQIFGWIPFSFGDVLYLLLFLFLIWILYKIVQCLRKKQWNQFWRWIGEILFICNVLYFVFSAFWGLNYSKPKPELTNNPSTTELKQYANQYLHKCQILRNNFSTQQAFSLSKKETNAIVLDLYGKKSSNIKASLFSFLLNYTGVLGYYNPFTGEAQYNANIPKTKIPITFAHEIAHQNGVAPENKANFVGFINGIQSKNSALEYSANYMALRYLLSEIYAQDSAFVMAKLERYSPAMQLDRKVEQAYREKYNYKTKTWFRQLNNAYLRANHQERGVESYSDFVLLLIDYERKKQK